MAASPAAAGTAGLGLMRIASATLAAPFAASSTATSTPALTPDARKTFAAPRFPLPTVRKSVAPQRRESRRAKGTDPIRYAVMTARVMDSTVAPEPARNDWRLLRITDFRTA